MSDLRSSVIRISKSKEKKKPKSKKRLEVKTLKKLEEKMRVSYKLFLEYEAEIIKFRDEIIDTCHEALAGKLSDEEREELKIRRDDEQPLFDSFRKAWLVYLECLTDWVMEYRACVKISSERILDNEDEVKEYLEKLQDSEFFKDITNVKEREEPWLLQPDEIEYGVFGDGDKENSKLGGGAFGTVYRGICHGIPVAIKEINIGQVNSKTLEIFHYECEIMSFLRHKNIILFMGGCIEEDNIRIVLELATNGSLDDALYGQIKDKKIKFHLQKKIFILRDIAAALNWLHNLEKPILHLDLKPPNILFDNDFNPKLADFGISLRHNSGNSDNKGGTSGYIAPELYWKENHPTHKSDVYSFGVLAWELMNETSPIPEGLTPAQATYHFAKKARGGERAIETLTEGPQEVKEIIEMCLTQDPENRPSLSYLLEDGFFQRATDSIFENQAPLISFWRSLTERCPDQEKDSQNLARQIHWETFLEVFMQFFGLPPSFSEEKSPIMECLKDLLGVRFLSDKLCFVTYRNFSKFYSFFERGIISDMTNILRFISNLYKESWWFGFIDRNSAEELLRASRTQPTYLVRASLRTPESFTISYLHTENSPVQHIQPVVLPLKLEKVRGWVKKTAKGNRLKKPLTDAPGNSIYLGKGHTIGYTY